MGIHRKKQPWLYQKYLLEQQEVKEVNKSIHQCVGKELLYKCLQYVPLALVVIIICILWKVR